MGIDKSEFVVMSSASLCLYLTESTSPLCQQFIYIEISWCEKESSENIFFPNVDVWMSVQFGIGYMFAVGCLLMLFDNRYEHGY